MFNIKKIDNDIHKQWFYKLSLGTKEFITLNI